MIFLIILCIVSTETSLDELWWLRSGAIASQDYPASTGSVYLASIRGTSSFMEVKELKESLLSGQNRLLFPLASRLVRSGSTGDAELFWITADDPPADRGELLAALAWFGRYQLYALMADRGAVPPDMSGRLHEEHAAAVCAAGWMTVRTDGLFHPDNLVMKGDLILLSRFFPRFSGLSYLPVSKLNSSLTEEY